MDRAAAEVDRSLERGHILALDGLRGIAILLVLACHFVSNLKIPAAGIAWPFVTLAHAGWTGVDLFFVLSGFLITGILVDARESPSYFKAFYARRVLRIIPAYYGFLFAIFILLPSLHLGAGDNYMLAREHQSWYWLHLTNFMMAIDGLPGRGPYPSTLFWSLAVEEQFYLLWPAVVALCSTATLRKVCVAGALGCMALRIAGGLGGVPGLTLGVLPFTRGDTLFVGGLLAIEYRAGNLDRYARAAGLSALAGALVLAALTVLYGQIDYLDPLTAMFGSIAITAIGAWAVITAVTVGARDGAAFLRSKVLRFYGRYSYALYIVHTAVLAGLDHYRPFALLPRGARGLFAKTVWLLVYVGVSTGIAMASWHLVEKHFLRLKRHFPYRRRAASVGSPHAAHLIAENAAP